MTDKMALYRLRDLMGMVDYFVGKARKDPKSMTKENWESLALAGKAISNIAEREVKSMRT